jgi:hypothetical protein
MWVELRILHHYREKYGIVVTPEELGYGPGPGVPMGGQGISAEPDDDSNDEMEMDDEYSDDTLYQADAEMDAQLSERELNQQVADNESLEEEQDEEN